MLPSFRYGKEEHKLHFIYGERYKYIYTYICAYVCVYIYTELSLKTFLNNGRRDT